MQKEGIFYTNISNWYMRQWSPNRLLGGPRTGEFFEEMRSPQPPSGIYVYMAYMALTIYVFEGGHIFGGGNGRRLRMNRSPERLGMMPGQPRENTIYVFVVCWLSFPSTPLIRIVTERTSCIRETLSNN